MKTLKTLVKLSKNELDRLRQELNVYLEKKDELLRQKERLKERLVIERKVAEQSFEANFALANFSSLIASKQEQINQVVIQLDINIEKLSTEIAVAFAELKKYEIMLEKKKETQRVWLAAKERTELDEIGMMGYLRKKKVE